jgi:hypothetical protein
VLFADGKTRTNTRYNGYLTHLFARNPRAREIGSALLRTLHAQM